MRMSGTNTRPVVYPYHIDIVGKSTIPYAKTNPKYIKYRRQWELNPLKKIVSRFPLHLDIETTARCNLMCRHCLRFSRRTSIGDMDITLFKKIIDGGKRRGLYAINLSWLGEPFLHPRLMDMAAYAKTHGVLDVIVNTNGTLVDNRMSGRILRSGSLDTIVFSLDAITEKKYNRIKFGSDFKLVNRNIDYLLELREKRSIKKPRIIVQMIDQRQAHDEMMAFIQYWRTRADRIRIAIYQSPDGRPNDKLRAQNPPEIVFPCPHLWQRLAVAWDGTVYCSGDNACRQPLGSVHAMSIYDIWHSHRLRQLRRLHDKYEADTIDACLHCDLNKIPKIVKDYGKDKTLS